jgi:hypothetical protein
MAKAAAGKAGKQQSKEQDLPNEDFIQEGQEETLPKGLTAEDLAPSKPAKAKAPKFDRVRCEIHISVDPDTRKVSRSYERLKVLKSGVKITAEEAQTLNRGVLEHGDQGAIVQLYLSPESTEE